MRASYAGLYEGGEDESDGDDDIDDLAECSDPAQPLLRDSEGVDEGSDDAASGHYFHGQCSEPDWLPRKKTGWRQLLGVGRRRKRGPCPICFEEVRSGAHVCSGAQWRVKEGQLADAVRCDGNAHFRALRYDDAVASYSQALAHSHEDAKLLSNRCAAYIALKRWDEALTDAEAAIRAAPAWSKPHCRKARVFELQRKWDSAIQAYQVALQACAKPEDQVTLKRRVGAVRARRAAVLRVEGFSKPFCTKVLESRQQRKCRDLAGTPAIARDDEVNVLRVAEEAKLEGNDHVAQQCFEAADVCYARGLELLAGYHAETCCHEAAALESALLLNKALCDIRAGRHLEAATRCNEVLELDPFNIKARFRLASALGELQDYDSALQELDVALVVQPAEASCIALRQNLRHKRTVFRQREKDRCSRMILGVT